MAPRQIRHHIDNYNYLSAHNIMKGMPLGGDTYNFNFIGNSCWTVGRAYSTSGCCHSGGSFWGGFKFGCGFNLASLAMGFLGGFMNFPMMGGFAGMFPMYTGGLTSAMSSWWDGNGKKTKGNDGESKEVVALAEGPKDVKPAAESAEAKEKAEKLAAAKQAIEDAIADLGDEPTKEAIEQLLQTLEAKKADLGDTAYNDYLKQIYQKAQDNGIDALTGSDGSIIRLDDALSALNGTETPEDIVDAEWQPLINAGLSDENITALKGLGVKPVKDASYRNSDEVCLSLPSELNAEKLTALKDIINGKNIHVAAAHNTAVTKTDKNDPWITGKLGDISTNSADLLSFTIDCNGVGLHQKKYTIEQLNNGEYVTTREDQIIGKHNYTFENGVLVRTGAANYHAE